MFLNSFLMPDLIVGDLKDIRSSICTEYSNNFYKIFIQKKMYKILFTQSYDIFTKKIKKSQLET